MAEIATFTMCPCNQTTMFTAKKNEGSVIIVVGNTNFFLFGDVHGQMEIQLLDQFESNNFHTCQTLTKIGARKTANGTRKNGTEI